MKRTAAIGVILICAAGMIFAWWAVGHAEIDRAAFQMLPDDMPEFFREQADAVLYYSAEPDKWTDIKPSSLRETEKPEHYFDLEYLKGEDIPASRV